MELSVFVLFVLFAVDVVVHYNGETPFTVIFPFVSVWFVFSVGFVQTKTDSYEVVVYPYKSAVTNGNYVKVCAVCYWAACITLIMCVCLCNQLTVFQRHGKNEFSWASNKTKPPIHTIAPVKQINTLWGATTFITYTAIASVVAPVAGAAVSCNPFPHTEADLWSRF